MKIENMLDLKNLEKMVDEGYIRAKTHDTLDLTLYNYSEKATFERMWNPETLECRGLIVAFDGTVVARPYKKFFNFSEHEESEFNWDAPVEVTDKLDGSLGVWWRWNGRVQISTRGSFNSDQAVWATNWLRDNFPDFTPPVGLTPMFEIVYPENRIVLDYGQFAGLVLLGYRAVETGALYGPEYLPDHWKGHRAEVLSASNLFQATKLPDRENAEGVVVRFLNTHAQVKLKQEDYVRAHSVVTGMTNKAVWRMLVNGEDIPEKSAFMPDEFFDWLKRTERAFLDAHFNKKVMAALRFHEIREAMDKAGEFTYGELGERIYDRKSYAARVLTPEYESYKAPLFMLMDGKPIDGWAWVQTMPTTIERPWGTE